MKTKTSVQRTTSAKKPKGATKTAAASPSVNGATSQMAPEVFTLSEAATFLRVAEEEVRKPADAGKLPGKKVGDEWRILKSALCAWLSTPELESQKTYHARIMATAGTLADDDTAMEMLERIYEDRRKHPLSEIQD